MWYFKFTFRFTSERRSSELDRKNGKRWTFGLTISGHRWQFDRKKTKETEPIVFYFVLKLLFLGFVNKTPFYSNFIRLRSLYC